MTAYCARLCHNGYYGIADASPAWAAGFALDIMRGIGTENGVIAGAGLPIQRMDAAAFVYQTVQYEAAADLPTFTDQHELPEYATKAVLNLAAKGIVNGYLYGSFNGGNAIPRAETAALLSDWMELLPMQ